MDGPGIIKYPNYCYHGKFERNLPIGPGCFTFEELNCMQHGFYVNLRDPAFDYVGADELALNKLEGGQVRSKTKHTTLTPIMSQMRRTGATRVV